MAITWEFEITPIDPVARTAKVTAVRTDDAVVSPEAQYTVTLAEADLATSAKKTAAMNVLWNKYLAGKAERARFDAIAAEVTDLKAAGKANFEQREVS